MTKRQRRSAARLRSVIRAAECRRYDAMFRTYVSDCGLERTQARWDELCRLTGRNRSSFGRVISRLFGKTPTDILRDLRIEEAKRLLSVTDLPLDEVAAASAFGHRSTLHRVFVAAVGMGPAEYREAAQRKD